MKKMGAKVSQHWMVIGVSIIAVALVMGLISGVFGGGGTGIMAQDSEPDPVPLTIDPGDL